MATRLSRISLLLLMIPALLSELAFAQAQWTPEDLEKIARTRDLWATHPVLHRALPKYFSPSKTTESLEALVPSASQRGAKQSVRSLIDEMLMQSDIQPQVAAALAIRQSGAVISESLIDTLWAQREAIRSLADRELGWVFKGADLFGGDGPGLVTLGDYHVAALEYSYLGAWAIFRKNNPRILVGQPVVGRSSSTQGAWVGVEDRQSLVRFQTEYDVARVMLRDVDAHLVPALVQIRRQMRAFLPERKFDLKLPDLSIAAIDSFFETLTLGLDGATDADGKPQEGFLLKIRKGLAARSHLDQSFDAAVADLRLAEQAWKKALPDLRQLLQDSARVDMVSQNIPGGVPYFQDLSDAVLRSAAFDLPAKRFVFDARGQYGWSVDRGQRIKRITEEEVTFLDQAQNGLFFSALVSVVHSIQGLSPDAVRAVGKVFPSFETLHGYPANGSILKQNEPWSASARLQVASSDLESQIVFDHRLRPFVDEFGHFVDRALGEARQSLEAAAETERQLCQPYDITKTGLLAELRALLAEKPTNDKAIQAKYAQLDEIEARLNSMCAERDRLREFEDTFQKGGLLELYRFDTGRQSLDEAKTALIVAYIRSVVGSTRVLEVINFLGTESFFASLDLDGGGIGTTDNDVLGVVQKLVHLRR